MYILGGTFVFCVFIFTGIRYVILEDKLYVKLFNRSRSVGTSSLQHKY